MHMRYELFVEQPIIRQSLGQGNYIKGR